jgi:hypothetical protein
MRGAPSQANQVETINESIARIVGVGRNTPNVCVCVPHLLLMWSVTARTLGRRACSAHMRTLLMERIFGLADMAHLLVPRTDSTQVHTTLGGRMTLGSVRCEKAIVQGRHPARKSHFIFQKQGRAAASPKTRSPSFCERLISFTIPAFA